MGSGYFENGHGNKDINKLLRFACIIVAFIGFVGMFLLTWVELEIPWYHYAIELLFVLGAVYPAGIKKIVNKFKS